MQERKSEAEATKSVAEATTEKYGLEAGLLKVRLPYQPAQACCKGSGCVAVWLGSPPIVTVSGNATETNECMYTVCQME